MKKYKDIVKETMDFEKTIDIFVENYEYIQKDRCYNNVFNTLPSLMKNKNSKVVYGFVISGEPFKTGVIVRHCWSCIDEKIADATMFVDGYINNNFIYIPFVEYTNLEEYIQTIEENNNYPCLEFDDEEKFIQKIEMLGYKYLG